MKFSRNILVILLAQHLKRRVDILDLEFLEYFLHIKTVE